MRPITSFAIHAFAATALVAFAASGAAAKGYIKLGDIKGEDTSKGRGGEIEIDSFAWGPRQSTAKLQPGGGGGGANKAEWSPPSTASRTGGGSSQMRMEDSPGSERRTSDVGASETITIGSGRNESAQATGKRQHLPIRIRTYYDSPLPSGSLRVKVKMPWLACEVGRKYPSLTLSDGTNSQVLHDVTVSSCEGGGASEGPEESITFVYGKLGVKTGKVIVRGWDPEKKEQ